MNIKIFFCDKRSKFIADPISLKDNPKVGMGNTPHEALGDLVLTNIGLFNITNVEKTPIRRSDILRNHPEEVL
jgi:hypothetical protein